MKKELQFAAWVCLIFLAYSRVFYASISSLNNIEYKDTQGNLIVYNHLDRIQEIKDLLIKGKKLHMVLGRGTMEVKEKDEIKHGFPGGFRDWTEPLGDNNNIWVYANLNRHTQQYGKYPHLIFDFNDDEHLDSLPDNTFTSIAFDFATVKFISNPFKTLKKLGKKLTDEGYLYILPGSNLIFPPSLNIPTTYASSTRYLDFYSKALASSNFGFKDFQPGVGPLICTIENDHYPLSPDLEENPHLKCQKRDKSNP